MSTAISAVESGGAQTLAGPITATPHAAHAGYTCWKIGDKTGNNGKDASGDIAMAWPTAGGQGGSPTPKQFEAVFAEIGRMAGWLALNRGALRHH